MSDLNYKTRSGELIVNCDCGRIHTITAEVKGDKKEFFIETDETNLKGKTNEQKENGKETGKDNGNESGKQSTKKSIIDSIFD